MAADSNLTFSYLKSLEKTLKSSQRIQLVTKTLYNLYICKKKVTLHVVFCKWQYIVVINSYNSFFSQLEEMKSCIYRVEAAIIGIGL